MLQSWTVSFSESGMRLAQFLKGKLESSYSLKNLKSALEKGACAINGRIERFSSSKVVSGDKVTFQQICKADLQSEKESSFNILYEDSYCLVLSKPAALSMEELLLSLKKRDGKLEPVHRLDRDTSGALLFSKGTEHLKLFTTLFRTREIEKVYLALVDGVVGKKEGVIRNYLGKLAVYQGQTLWGAVSEENGSFAETRWICEKKGKNASLLRCFPRTGRTHQIRVHLADLGHPILGDYQYGRHFLCDYRPTRHLLHAEKLAFLHPMTHLQIEVSAPLPTDFQTILRII